MQVPSTSVVEQPKTAPALQQRAARLPPASRLEDPEHWKALMPELSFTPGRRYPSSAASGAEPVTDSVRLRADILQHGYHVGRSGLPFVKQLAASVRELSRAGLHPIWAVLSDEMWILTKGFEPLLQATFPDLRLLADFYVFLVDPNDPSPSQRQGWSPHRDRDDMPFQDPDRVPQYVTVWISVTEATPENGCIYLVPAQSDPNYYTEKPWKVPKDLQSIIAVPVAPGTPIFWTGRVIHWGGRVTPLDPMRLRVSVAFAAASESYEESAVAISGRPELPSLAQRLDVIFNVLEQYKHRLSNYADYARLRAEHLALKKG